MPTIRSATSDDLPAIGLALARSFEDDPIWRWMAGPSPAWEARAAAWFAVEARLQLEGHGEVLVDDQVRGAAIWSPPERWKPGAKETVRIATPSIRLFRTRLPRALAIQGLMAKHHPVDPPHWYLAVLGTDPAHQGAGVGSALIAAITDRCDAEGLPAYLESSKERNISFYARHGFEVQECLAPRGGPSMWRMWREPRG